jgi:Fe-S-cluster-containing hydrogenase component 2
LFPSQEGGKEGNSMTFDMPSCGGCRTCEMACSFKHKGAFIPAMSSIKILDNENEPGFHILLFEESDGQSIPCDGCKEEDLPLCMQYCIESEKLEKILKEFMDKVKTKGESKETSR